MLWPARLATPLVVGCALACSSSPAADASAVDPGTGHAGSDDGSTPGEPDRDASTPAVTPGAPSGVAASVVPVASTVTTLAGSGLPTCVDATGAAASFKTIQGVAVDAAGNVYLPDAGCSRLRKVTPAGVVTTLAGSGTEAFADGTGTAASFRKPLAIAVDASGNVYVADTNNHRVRKVTPAGVVTTLAGSGTPTFADGAGAAASFQFPQGVAVDALGNVYVSDTENYRIRKVTPAGIVTTLAGSGTSALADGAGAAASFNLPRGLAVDATGNVIVADSSNARIRKVTPAGVVSTLAGTDWGAGSAFADGPAATAKFGSPVDVALDPGGNIYVADNGNARIRKLSPAGVVSTLAGSGARDCADGPAATASFFFPEGVAVDTSGNVYVADSWNQRLRKITSVGIGQLAVSWVVPRSPGSSPITKYTATATASGHATQTCTTTGATGCAISGLASGVSYSVSVTATNAAGAGPASTPTSATPT